MIAQNGGSARDLGGPWHLVARGSQHEVWADQEKAQVLRIERGTLASRLAHRLAPDELRREVKKRLNDLILEKVEVQNPRWRDPLGKEHLASRGQLGEFLPTDSFLSSPLWRNPHPRLAAEGLEGLIRLLEDLADRGFLMIDFVSDNFVYHEGTWWINDADLIVPAELVSAQVRLRLVSWGFRVGLGRDYRNQIAARLLEASAAGEMSVAEELSRLQQKFADLLPTLYPRALREAQKTLPETHVRREVSPG